ncbi:MAG: hypothetical protein KI786_18405 [Mameliella sp.]|nr:hypothetical protein [Phaeodactylibacter sp.]NRA51373.1 hypothetical protein [Phaeodactylibacter sp.]
MTKHEIRGMVGQFILVVLSLLPMYLMSAQDAQDQAEPAQEITAESYPHEVA